MYSQNQSQIFENKTGVKTFPNLSAIEKMKCYEEKNNSFANNASLHNNENKNTFNIELLIILLLLLNDDNNKDFSLILPIILKLLV